MTQHSFGQVRHHLSSAIDHIKSFDELPFRDVLSSEDFFGEICAHTPRFRERIYSPVTTLLAFLLQSISDDSSCARAVTRVNADRLARGLRPVSTQTTASYCEARQRLPEGLPKKLVQLSARQLEQDAPEAWLWHRKHVKLVDGTTVTMPDTAENQADYPQNVAQKPGLGFPIARIVAVFSLATAALIDFDVGPYAGKGASELGLLRRILDAFGSGDVMLADSFYCSYFLIAALGARGVDCVFRHHGARKCDFRRGERLGQGDHLVEWERGPRPDWMPKDEYDCVPKRLKLREVKVTVDVPGFRSRSYVVVTTLLSARRTSPKKLADLYRQRWQAEVDLRTLKCTMHTDVLRSLTPGMVRKEIGVHFLAYNLIRKTMAQSAALYALSPREISFKATLQGIEEYRHLWAYGARPAIEVYQILLYCISRRRVGMRLNRVEPRVTKRRLKRSRFMTKPRSQYKKTG